MALYALRLFPGGGESAVSGKLPAALARRVERLQEELEALSETRGAGHVTVTLTVAVDD